MAYSQMMPTKVNTLDAGFALRDSIFGSNTDELE